VRRGVRRRGKGFFFIFKHSWALKRSWKISHGGPGKVLDFLSVKVWEHGSLNMVRNVCAKSNYDCCVFMKPGDILNSITTRTKPRIDLYSSKN